MGISMARDCDRRSQSSKKVGSVRDLPNEKAARERLQTFGLNINLDLSERARPPQSFSELVAHYKAKELAEDNQRKTYSTKLCYEIYLTNWIVPRWGSYTLAQFENGIAVHVEEWLDDIKRSRGTRAKMRDIMSAVCAHAIRYGSMKVNPIRSVRQSAKRERVPVPLTSEELQKLFAELGLRERALVLLDLSVGMRRGELLALQWRDADFTSKTPSIHQSIWQQHVGPVKTAESEKVMPLDDEMILALVRWRQQTPYAQDGDWIFASPRMHGRQPLVAGGTHAEPYRSRRPPSRHQKARSLARFSAHLLNLIGCERRRPQDRAVAVAACQPLDHHGHLHARGEQQETGGAEPGA